MFVTALVYVAGLTGLLWMIGRRLHAAQAAREAAFLRQGFGS